MRPPILEPFIPPCTADPPFLPPRDIELHLPFPPSVNALYVRKPGGGLTLATAYRKWIKQADKHVTANGPKLGWKPVPLARFSVEIILSENHGRADADNTAKALCDYAKRIGLIVDDAPKHMRKVSVEWGNAPHGCRLILSEVLG